RRAALHHRMAQVDEYVGLRHQPLQLLIVAPAEDVNAQRISVALHQSLKIGHIGVKIVGRPDDGVLDVGRKLRIGGEELHNPVDLLVWVDVTDGEQTDTSIRPSLRSGQCLRASQYFGVAGEVQRANRTKPAPAYVASLILRVGDSADRMHERLL